jgi:hypothetical protein
MNKLLQTPLAAVIGCGALAGFAGEAMAQGLVTERMLSAPLANQLVGDAVATCAQQGYA